MTDILNMKYLKCVLLLLFVLQVKADLPLCSFCACEDNSVACIEQVLFQYDVETWKANETRTLLLERCYLGTVTRDFFRPFLNISELQIYNNSLALEEDAFELLPQLIVLNLARNKLTSINGNLFRYNPRLKTLILSNNKITTVFTDSFVYSQELRKLHLNHNRISVIENGAFEGLESLRELDLRHNLLTSIDPSLFDSTPLLQGLRLENNTISSFGLDLVLLMTRAQVSINPNPLECECGPLYEAYIAASMIEDSVQLTCSSGLSWDVLMDMDCSLWMSELTDEPPAETGDGAEYRGFLPEIRVENETTFSTDIKSNPIARSAAIFLCAIGFLSSVVMTVSFYVLYRKRRKEKNQYLVLYGVRNKDTKSELDDDEEATYSFEKSSITIQEKEEGQLVK